jgi:transposase
VVGIAMRQGGVKAKVVDAVNATSVIGHLRASVEPTAHVISDELPVYNYVAPLGFSHEQVNHGAKEYVRGKVHTNTIDGFWSQLKRSIDGTHHHVSRKHLPKYLNEFSFRYSNRWQDGSVSSLFELMAERSGEQLYEAAA